MATRGSEVSRQSLSIEPALTEHRLCWPSGVREAGSHRPRVFHCLAGKQAGEEIREQRIECHLACRVYPGRGVGQGPGTVMQRAPERGLRGRTGVQTREAVTGGLRTRRVFKETGDALGGLSCGHHDRNICRKLTTCQVVGPGKWQVGTFVTCSY